MPTEKYVREKFTEGMAFEVWVERKLHELEDVKVVKRVDVSEEPHSYLDIKDVEPEPDVNAKLRNGRSVRMWVTHKKIDQKLWEIKRKDYIKEMFWRYKTYKYMRIGDYLLYGVFDKNANIINGDNPIEVLILKYSNDLIRGKWNDSANVNQDDLRAKIDMSSSKKLYCDSNLLINLFEDI